MRGAVLAARQRLALAGPAFARHRLAGGLHACLVIDVLRDARDELARDADVALDHEVDPGKVADREEGPDAVEERPRRPREVAAVGHDALDCVLAFTKHELAV